MRIKIYYTATAPVSHIGETASTGSFFNTIKTSAGKLPVISGNSIRGTLRDCLATHLLNRLNVKVDKEIFNVLYSGGNITGGVKNDVARAKAVRECFPSVSLLGAGLGTMIMSGKLMSGFVYPVCKESQDITGEDSEISWHDLIEEIEFTRFDDTKNDKLISGITDIDAEKKAKASTQMRFSVQYMAAGTEFVQELILQDETELECGALYTGLAEWFKTPCLGGMSARGFGMFKANVINDNTGEIVIGLDEHRNIDIASEVQELINQYNDFLDKNALEDKLKLLSVGKEK